MKLRTRFIMVGCGIVVFMLIAPVVLLYARGFKYDFARNTLVKTGTLVARSEPEGADLFLNNETESRGETDLSVRFLLPGDYNIRIEKDGYLSWSKRLNIRSQFVTWANEGRDFITLFFKQPKLVSEFPIQYASVSKDGTRIAYVRDEVLHEINADNQTDSVVRPAAGLDLSQPLIWTASQQLEKISGEFAQAEKTESNSNLSAALFEGNLFLIREENILIDTNVWDFTLDNNSVWYAQGSLIRRLNVQTNENSIIAELPNTSDVQLVRSSDKLYYIQDRALYVLNDPLEKIYSEAGFAFEDPHSGRLVYGSGNEVWVYNPIDHRSALIIRSLTPIARPALNLETGYLMFLNEGKIKAIELDGRDHRNTYTLIEPDQPILDFVVAENGKDVYTIHQASINRYQIR